MIKQYSVITILVILALSGCMTKIQSSSSQSPLVSPSQSPLVSPTNENKCPQGITVKLDGEAVPVTVPNPFQGFVNPALRIQDGFLMAELNIEEVGFFELLDFDANNLRPGIFEGDKFRLRLSYSAYSHGDCTNVNYRRDSKLIIKEYAATEQGQKLTGCFYGKLDCEGKVIEVNAAISGFIF